MQTEIAVRLYENPKYGNTYGKGLYHQALFNASADIQTPKVKYLLDYLPFDRWQHSAVTDDEMDALEIVREQANTNLLVSWIVRYDPVSKIKTAVTGFSTFNLANHQLQLALIDDASGISENWQLVAKTCKSRHNKNSPQLLATNAQLAEWS